MNNDLKLMHRVFTFKELKTVSNKLVNKNIPGLTVNEKHNTVECTDSQTQPSIVKSEASLENDHCLPYFEAQVLGAVAEDTINVGLIAKDNTNKLTIGKSNNSFGYYRGQLFLNKRKVGGIVPAQKLKEGDWIGMGVNCHKHTFLVIKNNVVVSKDIPVPQNWHEFFPAVGVSNQGQMVKLTYNPKDFKCNYNQLVKEIEQQIEEQIKREQINSTQIYPLVYEYLEFNGYSKTLSMLKEKQKDMPRIARLTKDPGHPRPAFTLEEKDPQSMIGEDDDMNEPLKIRSRIMSQRLPDDQIIIPQQSRRKNTEMNIEHPRKDSYLSNVSNISNFNQSEDNFYNQEEERQFYEPMGANEKFLLNEKMVIVELIRHKKIEKALELMEKHIPEFLQENYIVAFMKSHIFLRIIQQQGNTAAISYSKQQKSLFQSHQGTLFPFYNSEQQTVIWKPLKNIYTALTANIKNIKTQKKCDMISDKQFTTFASYMNSLIMSKMGYLGCSRLSLCVHNTTKVMEKLKSFKGHSCGIEFCL